MAANLNFQDTSLRRFQCSKQKVCFAKVVRDPMIERGPKWPKSLKMAKIRERGGHSPPPLLKSEWETLVGGQNGPNALKWPKLKPLKMI